MNCQLCVTDPLAFLSTELESLKQQGLYRKLRVLEGKPEAHTTFDHKSVVNLSSNNYLGLATHPKLVKAALDAVEKYGVGSGAVRTISGTMAMHMELEQRLATFKHVESVVVFQSGFAANAGTVAAVLTKDDVIISDELNHASIIDGARLSKATIKVFPHKDVDAARKIIKELPAGQKKILITDGVFSMDGDLGRVAELSALAEEYGAIMMVDDAHASGVFGKNGSGTVDHFKCHGRVDIQVGTLSKAIGVLGGYVAGSKSLIEFLYHRARPFLFSTSHPPAVTAACLAALDILETEPQWIEKLWDNTRFFKAGLDTARIQHRHERKPHYAGDRRRSGHRREDVRHPVRARCVRPEHRLPHRGPRQGPLAHHRGGHAFEGRPAICSRHVRSRRQGTGCALGRLTLNCGLLTVPDAERIHFALHGRFDLGRAGEALHAGDAGGLSLLRARHQHRGAGRAPLVQEGAALREGLLPGLHDAPVAGAPADVRRGPRRSR